jgi:hypothetical protein
MLSFPLGGKRKSISGISESPVMTAAREVEEETHGILAASKIEALLRHRGGCFSHYLRNGR